MTLWRATLAVLVGVLVGCSSPSDAPKSGANSTDADSTGDEGSPCRPDGTCSAGLSCPSDTCVDAGGGAGGLTGAGGTTTTGGARGTGGDGTSPADAGGTEAGADAGADDGGDGATIAAYDDPCTTVGARACVGRAQDLPALCDGTKWVPVTKCASGLLCDATPGTTAGTCRPILTECGGEQPGDIVCQGMNRVICGPDLVTSVPVDTCSSGTQTCTAGVCVPCGGGTANCDENPGDCETDLNATATCGTTCENKVTCSAENGTASCTAGVCGMSGCNTGYGDCGGANDGCETNLNQVSACGTTCGNRVACMSPTPACSAGACVVTPRSCDGLAATCGPSANESCCTSPLVTGGTFYRSYDGVSAGYTSQAYPATVSDFRLDKYEVTVGRFRKFKAAWDGGWRPSAGAGKHTHLNGGSGLADSGAAGYEPGWNTAWATSAAPTDGSLSCSASYQTWTSAGGANENRPINCMNWYQAQAFCIWDGGFLPSEAEWNYAAAGGSQHRVYPWSSPATPTSVDDTRAVYCGGSCSSTQNVGMKPDGNGRYGQADLAGNVWEWTLDWPALPYVVTCNNCAYTTSSSSRVLRGGSFLSDASALLAGVRRGGDSPDARHYGLGARCARTP